MGKQLAFVVHKHDATSLHFDFRLQIGDVMPSWAIPKGPTLDPSMKRLAMQTTDHSLEYATFEGIIEEGTYGAGPVMIWDQGFYHPEVEIAKGEREEIQEFTQAQRVMEAGLEKGEIKFRLFGKKLLGSFALVKTRGFGGKNAWLMIKHRDEFVNEGFDAKADDTSVVSGKNMAEIAKSGKIYRP